MDTVSIIFNAMNEVLDLELEQDDMEEMLDVNLLQEGFVDSLSIITLLSEIEEEVGYPIDIKKMTPEDLSTINALARAIERQA